MKAKHARKVYADTSVYGGVFDDEFARASEMFFSQVKLGVFDLFISQIVAREISMAPSNVRDFFSEMASHATFLETSKDALRLHEAYIRSHVLTAKWREDALHVALASVNNCSVIVSWNFKHIVNYDKIPLYNAVNLINGYGAIAIHSPMEVVNYEK